MSGRIIYIILHLAEICLNLGEFRGSYGLLNKCLQHLPENKEVWELKDIIEIKSGYLNEAIFSYQKISGYDPQPQYLKILGGLYVKTVNVKKQPVS